MDKQLTILLIEDEPLECKEIIDYAESLEDIRVAASTNMLDEAIKYAKDYLPDAIILDLELHKGGGDGIQFLQELRMLALRPFPYILITTNNTSSIIREKVRELGADFIMLKSQRNYCAMNVVEHIRALKANILAGRSKYQNCESPPETPERRRKRLTVRISNDMNHIGISPNAKGRPYLIDSIFLIYDGATQHICEAVAQKYKVTDASVERAMQNAINKAWRTTDIEDLQKYYTARIRSEKGVPTLTEFLHYYANRLKTEYEDN